MFIHAVTLENIRSYTHQRVAFPEGSTLLLGDIGSGKSSILLAIEFALFGTLRGELNANALLRNGKEKGSVELECTLNKRHVIIKRNLKRGKGAIAQESGFIVVDGIKTEGTAVELKSKILSLIGYPDELVTKSKSLIYRYTVYTPQEEMKKILFESQEERLQTLRKIFNIDTYERVRENGLLYLRELKTQKKVLESKLEDLQSLKVQREHLKEKLASLEHNLKAQLPVFEAHEKELQKLLENVKMLEEKEKLLEIMKKTLSVNENKKLFLQKNVEKYGKELTEIELFIKKLHEKVSAELPELDPAIFKPRIQVAFEKHEQERDVLVREINTLEVQSKQAQKTKESISQLDVCPVCLQKVNSEHRHSIVEKQNAVLEENKKVLEEKKLLLVQVQEKLAKLKVNEEKFHMLALKAKEQELEKKQLEEKALKKEMMFRDMKEIEEELKNIEKEQQELHKKLKEDFVEEISSLKKAIEDMRLLHRKEEVSITSLRKEMEMTTTMHMECEKRIEEKEKVQEQLARMNTFHHWMEEYFLQVVELIEKKVFAAIHREFDETFQNWFGIIMDDEHLEVRLDESFNPVVQQNGYESFVENLSGGEKTAIALAYRLSLNKVINEFIGTIKTNDVIILDEPTDGFSSEQLDNMREVLEKLHMKQTIMVSHEAKMESFVQNIIRVVKRGHESVVQV